MITSGQCPTCRARFRGSRVCSRCGADLTPLMLLSARAWQLRQNAKAALAASDVRCALKAATGAERMQHSRGGAFLRTLSAWLAEQPSEKT